jgi:HD superfamily phosphohydrolase
MAGVMHDIGHGPYSHTFDREVVGKVKVSAPDNFFKEVLHK